MQFKVDTKTTEKIIIDNGYKSLSYEELKQKIVEKTIWGDYYNGRKYISYVFKDGNIEGINDLGSFVKGRWSINKLNNIFSVEWDGYWDNWTGRAYDVNGKTSFFDNTTSQWRTTFNRIKDRRMKLEL